MSQEIRVSSSFNFIATDVKQFLIEFFKLKYSSILHVQCTVTLIEQASSLKKQSQPLNTQL